MTIEQRPVADDAEKREIELLLARCDLAEGLELPVFVPEPGALPDGGVAPLIAFSEGAVVGFLLLEGWPIPEGSPLVHPDYRRKGLGRSLVEAATAACRERRLKRWMMVADSCSKGCAAFAHSVGARYDSAEFRMDLDFDQLPPEPMPPAGCKLTEVSGESIEEFARTLAEAFDDPLDQVRVWAAEQAGHPGVRLLVARKDGLPIGTVRLVTTGFTAYLTAVAVLREFRGRGIGRWIVLSTVHELRREGWNAIRIEVDTTNEAAYRLYRECGFRETRTYYSYELLTGA